MERTHESEVDEMALKALMLRKRIDDDKKALNVLREKDAEFEKREAELAKSIEEIETDEERSAVDEAVTSFEGEKKIHAEAKEGLEREIENLEKELADIEAADAEAEKRAVTPVVDTREDKEMSVVMMADNMVYAVRDKLENLDVQTRNAIFAQDDVKGWISEIREHIANKRALTNVGLTIPQVFIGFLRENVSRYSKLYRHCNVQRISGEGRMVIMGSVPEGVWTECCATLNELSLSFNDVEVDCYKVGGYFKVCNATLEDSDLNLAALLLDSIGQAIGLALDKAILYGRNTSDNTKMPQGVMSRLVQTSQPAGYPATARPWADLHTSNIKAIGTSVLPVGGVTLYQDIIKASSAMKDNYARGPKTWVMNEQTYTNLQAEAMSVNAAGAIVSAQGGTMPILGGDIEVLDFVPNGVIIGGYFELYLLAERGGSKFAQSEHAFFIQDQTVFKGIARYDGVPVIAEAFMALGLNGATADATMTFASDTANLGA